MDSRDYVLLKEADGLLNPPVPDPAQAAIAVRSVTKTLPPQIIKKADARMPLWLGGQMATWEAFGQQPISSFTAPTDQDKLVLLVRTFYLTLASPDVSELDLVADAEWQNFLAKAGALVAAGLLPQAILDYWASLRMPTVTVLPPGVSPTTEDMIASRTQF